MKVANLLMLVPLLGSCDRRPPIAASIDTLIAPCMGLHRESGDWCRLSAVQQVPPLPADELATLCPNLNSDEARDQCWLLSVTSTRPRGAATLCDGVVDRRYQDMCHMEAARNLSGQSAMLEEVLKICDRAGSMKGECLYHIPGANRSAYSSPAHPEVLDSLTRRVITLSPEAGTWKEFAAGVGASAASLSPGAPDPCLNFPDPAIRAHCWEKWQQEAQSPSSR